MATIRTRGGCKLIRFDEEGLEFYHGSKVVLKLNKTGEIYIQDKLVDVDVEVVYGVREVLKNLERGNTIEIADNDE